MNLLDAAYTVLGQAGQPLDAKALYQRISGAGLWHSASKTPAATVGAQLYMDIKTKGASSRFARVPGKALFALSKTGTAVIPVVPASATVPVAAAAPTPASGGGMSFTDAAEQVLQKHANGQPMHYSAITTKALQSGLITTSGQTPAATMYAQILTEIQRRTLRGQITRFSKHGKGLVGLTSWQPTGLAQQIAHHNQQVRSQLHQQLLQMLPAEFETLIGRLLGKMGFQQVSVTPLSADGGIDVRGTLVVSDVVQTKMAVQVKRWKKNVQLPTVHQVRGSLTANEQGLIVTTSDFSFGARQDAGKSNAVPVALMNGEQLLDLLIDHGIGVHREPQYLIELGEVDDA